VTVSYFDTSAVVPLLVVEPSTPVCRDIWQRSERAASMLVADDAVGVSGDSAMITTWRDLGLPTVDTAVAQP
jgi:hypothetical protein